MVKWFQVLQSNTNNSFCTDLNKKKVKVKLATAVEGDPKASFSIATTPQCRGGR